jgi:DNA polymerase-3 subunit delta'
VSTHNRKILDALLRASKEDHLHHAYILSGPASVAKVHCVEHFAAEIFAENGGGLFAATAPDPSQLAERIQRRAHPDFTRLEEPPEGEKNGKTILEQVRELPKLLAYPPLEANKRVVLIPFAAELNDSAFNSILKILEEPPAHTMFFLLCRDPAELLPTIVSRCQVLRFAPLADAEMRTYLDGQSVTEELLGFAEGALERAELLLIPESGHAELRSQACEQLLKLWESSPRIPSSAQQWVEKIEGDDAAQVVVDSWEVLFRDLAFVASGASAGDIRFRDLHSRLAPLAARADTNEIPQRFSALNRFRVYRRLNGNLRLDFAALLTELQIFSVGKAAAAS